ncbi:hypothetical protein ACW7BJ_15965 [Azospirillum argentinense]
MSDVQRIALSVLACVNIISMFLAQSLADNGYITIDVAAAIVIFSLCVNIFIVMGEVEKTIGSAFSEFSSTKIFWTIVIAVGGYFARKGGLEDVNAVFHIDPSALPMTLIAASAMYFISSLNPVFIVILIVSSIRTIICFKNEQTASMAIAITSVFASGVSLVASNAHLSDSMRREKVYKIAHSTDFNGTFNCEGIDDSIYSVLFIGPEQRKILIAPKLIPQNPFERPQAEIFRRVEVPHRFSIKECHSS